MNKKTIDDCEEIVSHSSIVLREKKSKYKALNNQQIDISKYKVDGCIYKSGSNEKRCDYLLKVNQRLYFIELKGSDVKKGLEQILTSIRSLTPYLNYNSINARIITTRGIKPNRLNTYKEYRSLLALIGKEGIILRNTPFEENIN